MHFHVMEPPTAECYPGGEFEIEMASSHELEIRHKDLLPIIDNFPRARSCWIDRSIHHTWLLSLVTSKFVCFFSQIVFTNTLSVE